MKEIGAWSASPNGIFGTHCHKDDDDGDDDDDDNDNDNNDDDDVGHIWDIIAKMLMMQHCRSKFGPSNNAQYCTLDSAYCIMQCDAARLFVSARKL